MSGKTLTRRQVLKGALGATSLAVGWHATAVVLRDLYLGGLLQENEANEDGVKGFGEGRSLPWKRGANPRDVPLTATC